MSCSSTRTWCATRSRNTACPSQLCIVRSIVDELHPHSQHSQEDPEVVRGRLGKFSGSSAISSDMISGKSNAYGAYDPSRGSYGDSDDGSATLEKLKDSVAGFFDSFGK